MVVTAIISFASSTPITTIIKSLTALDNPDEKPSLIIGTKVQDPTTIQLTSSWPSTPTPSALQASPHFQLLSKTIHDLASSVPTTTIAFLKTFPSSSVSATLPLTEWVKTDFPASDASPAFQTKIEADFARFEAIYRQRGPARDVGEGELSTGWAEEQDGVRSFVVRRQWEGMSAFEVAVGTEIFKEGVGILMAWGAPFSLWHVETVGS